MKTITYNPETHALVPREQNGIFPELPKHAPIIHGIVCYDAFHMHQFAIRYMDSVIAAAPQPEQVDVGSVGWKHDCAALCANDIELWIDRCPHCGKPRHNHPPTDDELLNKAEQVESEPVYQVCMADSVSLSGAWIDVDEQTYHDAGLYKEYKSRVLYTTPQPDRTAELEAALKVAKDALNIAADKFHDYAEIHAAKEASPENDLKVERNLMLSSDMDKALAKINEVLK